MTTTRPPHQRATTRTARVRRRPRPRSEPHGRTSRAGTPGRSVPRFRSADAFRPPRLTGERPRRGATPASLLALHDAGYRAIAERLEPLGPARVLDVGCGEGFESLHFVDVGRKVVGVDHASEATVAARRLAHDSAAGPGSTPAFSVAQMDAVALGLADGAFDAVCSSHLVEHFSDPAAHVAELARVLALGGTAFFLTPNAPADFENPFHLRLFGPGDLGDLLRQYFEDVWVGGVDAADRVKADFAARRAKAARLLRLDVLGLRHRIPRSWYLALYTRLLPVAYALLDRSSRDTAAAASTVDKSAAADSAAAASTVDKSAAADSAAAASTVDKSAAADSAAADEAHGGPYGATADDWFVTDVVDETTLVIFAVCRRPRRRS